MGCYCRDTGRKIPPFASLRSPHDTIAPRQKGGIMANKNLCGKTVKREDAYEVWETDDDFEFGGCTGKWTWYVLKKYQSPEKENLNPYARWFCDVVTPIVPEGEMGDVYVREIKAVARRIK